MSENRKVGFVVAAENETKQTFDEIKRDAGSMAQSVEQSGKRAAKGMQDVGDSFKKTGDGADDASKKVDASTRSLINSIQRATAAAEAGEKGSSKYFETLAKQRGIGGDVLEPYLAQMRKAEAAQAASVKNLGSMEMSAKQTTAALRGVPAQFTDIFVSLQGGQAPLTVLLQQGGQLKDMFGGTGAAAKALGGYVLSLISPTTLLAAGVAAVGVAYYQGSKEQDAWVKGIVTTGNASGVTVSQLRDYARQIDAVVGTQAKAAEGLAAFAAAGIRGGEELKRYTQTAIEWEQATGQAVEKTAEQFSSLQKDPLAAVLKLNEGTNFLTASVYEQIASLEKQGDKAGAAELAMNALDAAMRERSKAIQDSLGYIERGWIAAKNAAKEAWDAMLGVGRSATLGDEIARVQALLDQKMTQPLAVDNPAMRESREKYIANLQRELTLLQDKLALEELNAAASAESARITQSRIEFDKKYAQALQSQLSLQDKLALARKEAADAGKSEAEITQVLAYITEQHNKSIAKGGDGRKAAQSSYQSLMVAINQSVAASENELKVGEKLTESQKLRLRYEQELATKKRGFTQQEKANIEMGLLAAEAAERNADAAKKRAKALEEEAKAYDKQVKKQEAFIASIRSSVDKLRLEEEGHMLAAAANISHAEAVERITLARLEESYAQMLQGAGSLEEIERIRAEIAARKELLGVLGQKAAREANAKAAEEAAKDWERTSKTIGDTLADYIMGGGKNAAQYLKRLFSTLVLQPVVQMVVGGVFGLGGNAAMAGQVGQLGQLGSMASGLSNLVSAFGKGAAGAASSVIGKAVPWLYDAGFKSVAQGLGAFQAGMASQQSIAAFTSALKQGGAQMAGAIAGAVMNGFAGYGISKLISGGYEVNKYVNKIAGVASAIPGVGLIAGVIGGAINRLFGRKLKDTGIEGTFGGEAGFVGNTYEYYKGGLFRSDKTKRNPLDEATRKEFADYYASMVVGTQSLGSVLGLDSSRLDSFTSQIKLSLKGLKPEEQEAKINEEFGRIQNELAQQVIGTMVTQASKTEAGALYAQWTASGLANRLYSDRSIDNPTAHLDDVDRQLLEKVSGFLNISTSGGSAFLGSQIGSRLAQQAAAPDAYIPSEYALADEKAIDTLTRLATSLTTVNSVLEELNHTLYAGSLAGADTAYKLSELFGGMEGFTAATSSFYENFFTADEQRSKLQAKLSEAFSAVDLTLPDIDASNAREQYRKLAEAQDLATESGRAAWAVIMQLGDAFASITPSIEDAKKALEAQAQAQAQAAKEALDARVDSAFKGLEQAVAAQRKVAEQAAIVAQSLVNEVKGVFDLLQNRVRSLYGSVDSTAFGAAAQGRDYIDKALIAAKTTGAMPELAELQSAIESTIGGMQRSAYATQFERERDTLILAGKLAEIGDVSGEQLTEAEKQLKVAKDQLAYLDGVLNTAREQIDALNGINGSVLSVEAALQRLAEELRYKSMQGGGGGRGVSQNRINALQAQYGGIIQSAIGSDPLSKYTAYNQLLAAGLTAEEIRAVVESMAGPQTDRDWSSLQGGSGNVTWIENNLGSIQNADPQTKGGYYNQLAQSGLSDTQIRDLVEKQLGTQTDSDWDALKHFAGVPGYANGGLHDGGLRVVGERGWELEATGPSRIWNQQQLAAALRGDGGGNAQLEAEMRALRAEMALLRSATERIASNTAGLPQMVSQIDNVTEGGNAMRAEVMA